MSKTDEISARVALSNHCSMYVVVVHPGQVIGSHLFQPVWCDDASMAKMAAKMATPLQLPSFVNRRQPAMILLKLLRSEVAKNLSGCHETPKDDLCQVQ